MADQPRYRNENLLACMNEKGWTVRQASEACGVRESYFRGLVHCCTTLSDRRANAIAAVFGKQSDEVFPPHYREAAREYAQQQYTPRPRPTTDVLRNFDRHANAELAACLKRNGWTVKKASEIMGIPAVSLYLYLNCRVRLSEERANHIASFFGKSGVELFPPAYTEFARMCQQQTAPGRTCVPDYIPMADLDDAIALISLKQQRQQERHDYHAALLAYVREAISLLPEDQRTIITRRFFDNQAITTINRDVSRQACHVNYLNALLALHGKMHLLAAGEERLPPLNDLLRCHRERKDGKAQQRKGHGYGRQA